MPIETDDQARALARVIHLLRPEWTEDSFYKVMLKAHQEKNPLLLDRPFEDILIAATRKASDPNARTPAVVWMKGTHWPPAPGRPPGPPSDPCEDHPEEPAHNCRCCRSDVITGLRPPDKIGVHHEIPTT